MGGVIQIIPKEIEKTTFDLKGLYGEDGTKGFRFYAGSKIRDKLSFSLGYEQRKTDGYIDQYVVKSISPGAGPGTTAGTDSGTDSGTGAGTGTGSGTGGGAFQATGSNSGGETIIPVTGWSKTKTPTGKDAYLLGDKGRHWSEIENFSSHFSFDFSPSMTVKALFMNYQTESGFEGPQSNLYNQKGNTVYKGSLQLDPNQSNPLVLKEADFLNSKSQKKKNTYQGTFSRHVTDTTSYKLTIGYIDEYRNRHLSPSKEATLEGGTGTLSDTPSTSLHMEGETHLILGEHGLTVGAGYLTNDVKNKEWSLANWQAPDTKVKKKSQTKGEDKTLFAFLQDEYSFNPKLSFLLGARYDQWESEGEQTTEQGETTHFDTKKQKNLTERLGFLYSPFSNTKIRGMIGTAFRTPPIHALYRTNISSNQITLMNPDLDPEKTFSWEIGGDWEMTEAASLRLTYFENRIKDMIYPRLVDPNTSPDTFKKENAGEGQTRGLEGEIEHHLTSWLTWWGNLTYQNAKITENSANPESEGKRVPLVPWVMANIGLDLDFANIETSLTGQYRGKVYKQDDNSDTVENVPGSYDPYFILNAKIGFLINEQIKLSLAVNNILDREYYEFNRAEERRFFGEIAYNY